MMDDLKTIDAAQVRADALREAAGSVKAHAEIARKKMSEAYSLGACREVVQGWSAVIAHMDNEADAILALIDQPAPAPVRVKPLVWHGKPEGQKQRIGRCGQISYAVMFDMGSWGYRRNGETGITVSRPGCARFIDEADAIDGADQDHERRIRDALE